MSSFSKFEPKLITVTTSALQRAAQEMALPASATTNEAPSISIFNSQLATFISNFQAAHSDVVAAVTLKRVLTQYSTILLRTALLTQPAITPMRSAACAGIITILAGPFKRLLHKQQSLIEPMGLLSTSRL
jgi:hypothetical protein